MMIRSHPRAVKAALPLLSIAVLFGVLELAAKIGLSTGWLKYRPPMTTQLPQGTEDWRLAHMTADDLRRPDPELWWRPRKGPPYNTQGFKGPVVEIPKPKGTIRIIAYGDSNTEGTPDHSWPQRLQVRLNERSKDIWNNRYEVLNAGVAGYSSHQGLLRFQQESEWYQPDIVLVSFGWNDLATTAGRPDHEFSPPPRMTVFLERFFLRFKFYLIARYYAQQSKHDTATATHSRVPLHRYLKNMTAFHQKAKANDAAAVFLTRPHRDSPEALRQLAPNWRADVPEYNRALLQKAQDNGGFTIDVRNAFDDAPHLFGDECHFTEEGQDEMALLIIRELQKFGLL